MEQSFERQSCHVNFRSMRSLVKQSLEMHTQLLEYRYRMKEHLEQATEADARMLTDKVLQQTSAVAHSHNMRRHQHTQPAAADEKLVERARQAGQWRETWAFISMRTGITDPDVFFQGFKNRYERLEYARRVLSEWPLQ
jgi:hypothetical protein